jgi:hypothetical protein
MIPWTIERKMKGISMIKEEIFMYLVKNLALSLSLSLSLSLCLSLSFILSKSIAVPGVPF